MVLLPKTIRNGLESLTVLNRTLVAQAAGEQPAEDDNPLEFTLGGGTTPSTTDPNTGDDGFEQGDQFEVRGRFATTNPFEFNRVKEWIEVNIFGGETTGMAPLINSFINEWDVEMARRQSGLGTPTGAPPTLETLLDTDGFVNGALWLPLTANNKLPPVFESTGLNADGEEVAMVGVANPLTGVEFIEQAELPNRPAVMLEMARRGSSAAVQAVFDSFLKGRTPIDADTQGVRATRPPKARGGGEIRVEGAERIRKASDINMVNFVLHMRPSPGMSTTPLPTISQEDLIEALTSTRPTSGSGSDQGRRDLVFDRNHLVAQVSDLYNSWMLDPKQAPPDLVGGIVDKYVREAKAFWSGKGGQLDFDTYVRESLRGLPRYRTIYEHKVPGQSEEQFLSSFQQPISQFGQTAEFSREQTEAAVTSGAGPAEQLKRVSRTREVEQSGGFSRKLANTLAGIGIG